jgi:hypothetical protein
VQDKSSQSFILCYCGGVATKTKAFMQTKTQKKYRVCNFRPWSKNEARIDDAARLNLNVSEIINEAIETSFDAIVQKKAKELQDYLKARGGGSFQTGSALLATKAKRKWCEMQGLNLRPLPCEGNALPLS